MKECFKVWWSSQVPITKFSLEVYPVKDIEEAKQKLKFLTDRDLKNSEITDNVGGLWFDDTKAEYEDDDGNDIFKIMEDEEE